MAERVGKAVGQQLGNYRLVRLLGRGGFTEVYLGEHIHLNTQAAIKVLYTSLTNEDVESFHNEARTIALLKHFHIVRVLDFNVQGDIPFIVMSYAPNGTLRQRHPSGTQLPLKTINSYVQQLADALQYATALQKDPHRRFASVQAFARAFQQAGTPRRSFQVALPASTPVESIATQVLSPHSDVHEFLSSTPPARTRRHFTRRTALIGLAVLIVGSSGGAVAWSALTHKTLTIYRGHTAEVTSVAWAPNSKHAASGSLDRTVQVWNPVTGHPTFVYRGHAAAVYAVAWSPDGTRIVSAGADHQGHVWNASTGRHILTYRGHTSSVNTVAWSPDGKYILSAGADHQVQIWTSTGHLILMHRGHPDQVFAVAWSPDGKRIASGSGGSEKIVQIWTTTGKHLITYDNHSLSTGPNLLDPLLWPGHPIVLALSLL